MQPIQPTRHNRCINPAPLHLGLNHSPTVSAAVLLPLMLTQHHPSDTTAPPDTAQFFFVQPALLPLCTAAPRLDHPSNSFGRRALLAELFCFLSWLVGFTVFMLMWQVRVLEAGG